MPDTAKVNFFMCQFFHFNDVRKPFQPLDEGVLNRLTHGVCKI